MARTNFDAPSPSQRACLQFALDHHGIKRAPGGYWVQPDFTGDVKHAVSFGTTTVQACAARDWLKADPEPAHEPAWKRVHRITPHGLSALKEGVR